MGRGGYATEDPNRKTYIIWNEAVLKHVPVITPSGGESKKGEGENISLEDHLKRTLSVSKWDPRPTLLYFHFPHEDGKRGKATQDQCERLDEEQVARWTQLYNCVEVDMEKSVPELAEKLGADLEHSSFAVIGQDLSVKSQSPLVKTNKQVVSFLKKTVTEKFPEFWSEMQKEIDVQKKMLEEARKLAKAKKYEEALEKYDELRRSTLRVADFWEDAAKEAAKVAKELAKQEK